MDQDRRIRIGGSGSEDQDRRIRIVGSGSEDQDRRIRIRRSGSEDGKIKLCIYFNAVRFMWKILQVHFIHNALM